MNIYLVGGAVRNQLLGLPVTERDYVVVGSTVEEMEQQGFRSVGKDFPVFLHPDTNEEYALARTERKISRGHTGFECNTEAVTLEEDLMRRDLTINAIAQDEGGELVDPWGGLADLESKSLRHVSDAFAEDPLRVLRVARFAALLSPKGFTIAPETRTLMQSMINAGMLDELPAERILGELDKALGTDSPAVFFEVLASINAGQTLWPEIDEHNLRLLTSFSALSADPDTRFAAIAAQLPQESVETLCKRLRVSKRRATLARHVCLHHIDWRRVADMTADQVLALLEATDAFRQPARFLELNDVLASLAQAQGIADVQYIAGRWQAGLERARSITAASVEGNITGPALGEAIRLERIRAIGAA